jgi:hypothetical protein
MPSTTEQPPESVPPHKPASGAEIAPLVAGDERPNEEDPVARAQREVEAASRSCCGSGKRPMNFVFFRNTRST